MSEQKQQARFVVLWCGHECAENPHATREAAEEWLARHKAEARRWRCGGIELNAFTIEERPARCD